MLDLLKQVRQLLDDNPGTVFYRFYGGMFHQGDVFTRLDKFNIYMLSREVQQGLPVHYVYELYGYRDSDPKIREPFIVFTPAPVFQITSNGPRRGSLQPGAMLLPGERFLQKTCRIRLEEGKNDEFLCSALEKDNFILQLLEDLIPEKWEKTPEIVFPTSYLCCPESNALLQVRKDTEALQWVARGLPGKAFDVTAQMIQNKKLFQVPAGTDNEGVPRVGYPYRYIYGRGVVGISNDLNSRWYGTPVAKVMLVRPDIHLDLRLPS